MTLEGLTYVNVEIVEAKNLPIADLNGKADPFCVVHVDGIDGEQRTSVKEKTLDPKWGESFSFDLSTVKNPNLQVEVFDQDPDGSTQKMGSVILQLSTLVDRAGEYVWLDLEPARVLQRKGQICLKFDFEDPSKQEEHPEQPEEEDVKNEAEEIVGQKEEEEEDSKELKTEEQETPYNEDTQIQIEEEDSKETPEEEVQTDKENEELVTEKVEEEEEKAEVPTEVVESHKEEEEENAKEEFPTEGMDETPEETKKEEDDQIETLEEDQEPMKEEEDKETTPEEEKIEIPEEDQEASPEEEQECEEEEEAKGPLPNVVRNKIAIKRIKRLTKAYQDFGGDPEELKEETMSRAEEIYRPYDEEIKDIVDENAQIIEDRKKELERNNSDDPEQMSISRLKRLINNKNLQLRYLEREIDQLKKELEEAQAQKDVRE